MLGFPLRTVCSVLSYHVCACACCLCLRAVYVARVCFAHCFIVRVNFTRLKLEVTAHLKRASLN